MSFIFYFISKIILRYLLEYLGTDGGPYEIGTTIVREAYRFKFNVSIWDGWMVMDNWVREPESHSVQLIRLAQRPIFCETHCHNLMRVCAHGYQLPTNIHSIQHHFSPHQKGLSVVRSTQKISFEYFCRCNSTGLFRIHWIFFIIKYL